MKFMAMMNSINFFKKLGLSMVAVLAISSCVKENMEPMANDSQDLMTISLDRYPDKDYYDSGSA